MVLSYICFHYLFKDFNDKQDVKIVIMVIFVLCF